MELCKKMAFTLLLYFAPVSGMIHFVLLLIAIDLLTGIYAAYKAKEKIVSFKLKRTVEKFVLYSTAILIGHMFNKEVYAAIDIARLITCYISITEIFSVFENMAKITGMSVFLKIKGIFRDQLNKIK
jgi:phage-related holin